MDDISKLLVEFVNCFIEKLDITPQVLDILLHEFPCGATISIHLLTIQSLYEGGKEKVTKEVLYTGGWIGMVFDSTLVLFYVRDYFEGYGV